MIYSIALYLYALAVVLVSPFRKKAWLMVKGQWNTFRILRKNIRREEMYVWFHAASLGEFEQGRPLMERLRREHPEYKILLTFFSPSGYEVRKDYEGADVVCYLPFDTPGNVRSFLRLARSRMAFFIKYEFWNNYLHACRRRQIPVYSVSSIFRENQVFFRWYGRSYSDALCDPFLRAKRNFARIVGTQGHHERHRGRRHAFRPCAGHLSAGQGFTVGESFQARCQGVGGRKLMGTG